MGPTRMIHALIFSLLLGCSPSGGNGGDADVAEDADVEVDGDEDRDSGPGCRANDDQVITFEEAPVVLGASLVFQVNAVGTRPWVDVEGELEGGVLTWRFETTLAGDRFIEDLVHDASSTRAAASFPEATHASVVPGFESALGYYRVTEEGVELVGLASARDDSTLVTYDPPVFVARFPLEEGASWSTETRATGMVENIAFNARETYRVTVDGAGEVVVPAGTFPALRVRTELERVGGPLSDQRVSYAWIAECWGRVAYVGSGAAQTSPVFHEAEQLWRLTIR